MKTTIKVKLKPLAKACFLPGLLGAMLTMPGQAGASLIERSIVVDSGENVSAYYDDVLDITWLKDANYAQTSGYNLGGKMTWSQAKSWTKDLTLGGYADWRLPQVQAINPGGLNYIVAFDGSSDYGYNSISVMHEMAYMFTVNLGLASAFNTDSTKNDDWVSYITGDEVNTSILGNEIEIDNLKSYKYWYGQDRSWTSGGSGGWAFNANNGYQFTEGKDAYNYAWVVHDGDIGEPVISEVPEPGSLALFGLAIFSLRVRNYVATSF
ncbi:PEP-CTERM sorting domain-containing protein [Thalassomonas actiniarum]|uniref:DUF1566 domain-containing protein n=1 Tax=Thalassomonas actiniarum TaxID=485447 RepID=A0AAF0C5R2_9GAMM|nr:PEP-CTERM sorting domain-containing protein [Thalassomonas actiniarum]WDE01798.1 DUF1566 domain-containing protein [Thalassomonas actiniarum]